MPPLRPKPYESTGPERSVGSVEPSRPSPDNIDPEATIFSKDLWSSCYSTHLRGGDPSQRSFNGACVENTIVLYESLVNNEDVNPAQLRIAIAFNPSGQDIYTNIKPMRTEEIPQRHQSSIIGMKHHGFLLHHGGDDEILVYDLMCKQNYWGVLLDQHWESLFDLAENTPPGIDSEETIIVIVDVDTAVQFQNQGIQVADLLRNAANSEREWGGAAIMEGDIVGCDELTSYDP